MNDRKEIKQRALSVGLPIGVWARLASEPASKIHQPNLSNWLSGEPMSEAKVKRVMTVLEAIEELCEADELKLNLSDTDNVRLALARFAERRAFRTLATDKRTVAESSQS